MYNYFKCNLIGFDKDNNRTVLVKEASLEYCDELARQWIENHPEKYEVYCIFIFNGIWDCKFRYERLVGNWYQKCEIKEVIRPKKDSAEE